MPLMKWADTEAGSGLIVSADWSPGAELSTNSDEMAVALQQLL